MYDKQFTPGARSALRLAQAAAGELGHGYVGSEHLLLGVLQAEGPARCCLREQAVTPEKLRTALRQLVADRAAALGAGLTGPAASALLERCGEDPYLLENEVDKLAAAAGYRTITPALVAEMGVVSLEADVFEMVRLITARNAAAACKKLHVLLRLGNEPIAVTAAMIGSYVDLYRVKLGQQHKKNYSAVFKDFGYKGSDYRLKRSAQTAAGYTLPQLRACLGILLELDQALKGQPVAPQILLETALCRLAMEGGGR